MTATQPTAGSLRMKMEEVYSPTPGLSRSYWHVCSWEFKGKAGRTGKCTTAELAQAAAIAQMKGMGL